MAEAPKVQTLLGVVVKVLCVPALGVIGAAVKEVSVIVVCPYEQKTVATRAPWLVTEGGSLIVE